MNIVEAASNGDLERVWLLLYSGVNINATNENLNTALHLSVFNGHVDVVKLLLQKRPMSTNATDKDILHYIMHYT